MFLKILSTIRYVSVGMVEESKHFLLTCDRYSDLRQVLRGSILPFCEATLDKLFYRNSELSGIANKLIFCITRVYHKIQRLQVLMLNYVVHMRITQPKLLFCNLFFLFFSIQSITYHIELLYPFTVLVAFSEDLISRLWYTSLTTSMTRKETSTLSLPFFTPRGAQ